MTIYMIIDTQNDPEETDENGMSEAFVKSTKTGRIKERHYDHQD